MFLYANVIPFFQNPDDDKPTDLFTSEGLRPSMDDLDNLFEDSSDETEVVIFHIKDLFQYSLS